MGIKIPDIRIKGFNEEWVERELGAVAEIKTGPFGSSLHAEAYVEYGHAIITTEHFKSGELPIDKKGIPQVCDEDYLRLKAYLLKTGDIVFSRVGSVDINAHVTDQQDGWLFSGRVLRVRSNDSIDSEYLHHELSTSRVRKSVVSRAVGQTMPSINTEILKITPIHYPVDKTEQTAIGTYFQKLDNLIKHHQQKHDKLSNIKKAMLEKMFPKQGETIPEIRFKGFSGEWEEVTLGEYARFTKGQGYSKSDLSESGTPIILYGRLYTNYQTVISQVETFAIEKAKSLKSVGNEVIVPASGESSEDIARASAVCESGVILGGDLNIIYPNDKINPVFLALVISNGYPQKELASKAQGKSVVHIRNSDLDALLFTIPKKEEQTVIGNYFQKLDTLINQHQQQITKLNNIKQACLSKMFV